MENQSSVQTSQEPSLHAATPLPPDHFILLPLTSCQSLADSHSFLWFIADHLLPITRCLTLSVKYLMPSTNWHHSLPSTRCNKLAAHHLLPTTVICSVLIFRWQSLAANHALLFILCETFMVYQSFPFTSQSLVHFQRSTLMSVNTHPGYVPSPLTALIILKYFPPISR